MKKTNSFLFVTYEINEEILHRYKKLQEESKDLGSSFFLLYTEENSNDNNAEDTSSFNFNPYLLNIDTLNELDYEPITETLIPGSNHFATLQFFLDNPEFDYYWVIEYDVIFTGNWAYFFNSFNSLEADFISSHIERLSDKSFSRWWNTLNLEGITLHKHQIINSFNPIYRISNSALGFLNNLLKGRKNWGHHEVLIPTALKYWGFKILDFGGKGEFVLPYFDERFYLMPSPLTKGTMRDTPQISETELSISNKLLNPVKTTKRIENQSISDNYIQSILINNTSQQELIKLNNEILWAHKFENTIRSSPWLENKSFSPGRWAVGYAMLYLIYRVLQSTKPHTILEFGLGESSKLTTQYAKSHADIYLNILEQDEEWLKFFENDVPDASTYTTLSTIIKVPVEYNLHVNHYENFLEKVKGHIYDFIVIDGPWGSPWHSRTEIIEIVEQDLLATNFVIIMDDYNRKGEKQTINALFDVLCKKNIPYTSGVYSGKKDAIIICSKCYKFLTTL